MDEGVGAALGKYVQSWAQHPLALGEHVTR
jgi:hypothetical protein